MQAINQAQHLKPCLIRSVRIRAILSLILFLILSTGLVSPARAKTTLYWSGVSNLGKIADLADEMPHIHDLFYNDLQFKQRLDSRVRNVALGSTSDHPEFRVVDELGIMQDDSFALSFVVSGAFFDSAKLESKLHVNYGLQAIVLIANFSKDKKKQRVVASYPIQVRFRHLYEDGVAPTYEEIRGKFASMLMGSNVGEADLVKQWAKRLQNVSLKNANQWIAIQPLEFTENAIKQGGFSEVQRKATIRRATSIFEGNLSTKANIPLVPMSLDDSGLTEVFLTFANREDAEKAFQTPKPSYVFKVTLYGLRSAKVQETAINESKTGLAFGGGFLLQMFYVEDETPKGNLVEEFSVKLQSIESISFLGNRNFNDPEQFSILVTNFMDGLSSHLIPLNFSWIADHKAKSEHRDARDIEIIMRSKLDVLTRS